MKILHTSDWHLGHTLHEHERAEEQADFLRQLTKIINQEKPDAMVVCGDIFDRTQPSVWARELYTQTLLQLHDSHPEMKIVVTAGNHDGKSALQLEGKVWERLNINVVGQIERDEDGNINLDQHIVEVSNADGEIIGFVAAVPHIYEQNFPQVGDVAGENRQRTFFQTVLNRVAERNPQHLPVVLTAHLAMTGSDLTGHDFKNSIGGIDTVAQDNLGQGYDYLALGHIHQPQTLSSSSPVARYCGTPIALHFDEHGNHGVSIVTLESGKTPVIETRDIKNIRPLLTIPEKAVPFDEVIALLRELPDDEKSYVRLHILQDGPMPPNYITTIMLALEGKKAQFCTILPEYPKADNNKIGEIAHDFDPDNMPSALELAKMYYKSKFNTEMSDELIALLKEAIRNVEKKRENQ